MDSLPIDSRMTYGDMRRAITGLDVEVCSDLLPGDLCGAYIAEANTILIDRRVNYNAKRCALVHELFHWMHGDSTCSGDRRDKQEYRAKRETAFFLINEPEYRTAEYAYGGNVAQIADELNITEDLVIDYQRLLHDGGR